jgi:hypothetical protein
MNIFIGLLIGVVIWVLLLVTTLDFYGVRPVWYMLAGYWAYPLFQIILEKLDGF